jgi:hypothetical protein
LSGSFVGQLDVAKSREHDDQVCASRGYRTMARRLDCSADSAINRRHRWVENQPEKNRTRLKGTSSVRVLCSNDTELNVSYENTRTRKKKHRETGVARQQLDLF